MNKITSAALFFLASGIFTSVTVLSGYQILFTIPLIFFSYSAIKNKDSHLPKSAYWLLAFACIALLSLTLNFDLIPKPSKNFGRVKYFLFAVGGIYVLKAWLKESTDKTKKIIAQTFLLSIILAGSVALWNFFTIDTSQERVKALTDTMRYGYGSGMILLTILSALLNRSRLKWFDARLGILAFIIGFIGMYLTHTRGALLGFVCGLPFVLYFYRPKLGLIVGGLATLIVAVLGSFYLFGTVKQGEGSRFLMNKNNGGDVIRRSQWKAAIIATSEKPLLGWGLSNFHSQLKRIKEENNLDAKDYNDAHAHNLFLEVASGTGLLGLAIFLGWLLSWAYESLKGDQLVCALVIPFGVAFIISSQFEVTLDANNASMIFTLYSLSSSLRSKETK